MVVDLTPDLESRLAQHAAQQGLNPNEAVAEVIARYFRQEDQFVEAVKLGEAALDRGEFFTHEQVGERLHRFLQP